MMPAEHVYSIPGRGTVVTGKMERGTFVRNDKVQVVGYGKDISTVIAGLEMFHKTVEKAEPGDQLGILLRGLGPKDVRRGMVVLPHGHKHVPTDHVKAQLYVLKAEEGGSKRPIASYFNEHVYSLTWDCGCLLTLPNKDFIMPGDVAEVHMQLTSPMFIEPQQRFTIRQAGITIGTGVFTETLPVLTEEQKDRRARKKMMKAEMERLGFNPYGEHIERRLKPDYTNSPKENPMADVFKENPAPDERANYKKG